MPSSLEIGLTFSMSALVQRKQVDNDINVKDPSSSETSSVSQKLDGSEIPKVNKDEQLSLQVSML